MLTPIVRTETPQDYAAIADINVQAFGDRMDEALIVALLRQEATFDPELSLVAESDGRVVGHALFTPHRIRLMGETLPAVCLGPIAVATTFQRQGVGATLIAEGHERAREKGYVLSFLLGHPTYYPRFGYRQHAFGASSVAVSLLELTMETWEARSPVAADVPALCELWRHEEGQTDFALEPGAQLLDWLSPNPTIQALVYTEGGEIVGYARLSEKEPLKPRCFLAQNRDAARRMAGDLALRADAEPDAEIILPLHPSSASAAAFDPPTADSWDAAMVCPLIPSVFEDYYAAVQAGARPPGRPIWRVAFDLA